MAEAKELLLHHSPPHGWSLSLNPNPTSPSLFLSPNSLCRSSMAKALSSTNCLFFPRSLRLSFYFYASHELNLWWGKVWDDFFLCFWSCKGLGWGVGALLMACEDKSGFIWLSFSSLYFLEILVCSLGLSWFSLVKFYGFVVSYLWFLLGLF